MQNAISDVGVDTSGDSGVATRIAAATAARRRRPDYAAEVEALLEAARAVISRTGRARVADVVAEAGLSNDAFYRHFSSKDALVAALSEQATERIATGLRRRMADQPDAEAQVRCWLEGILAQVDASHAAGNVAVLGASTNANTAIPTGDHTRTRQPLAELLHQPFAELGSRDPQLDAELVTHAVAGRLAGHLYQQTAPSTREVEHLLAFCLATPRRP